MQNITLYMRAWCEVRNFASQKFACVVFVFAPQHETSCDLKITTKEDVDHWRKVIEERNSEVYRRIHDKSNEA